MALEFLETLTEKKQRSTIKIWKNFSFIPQERHNYIILIEYSIANINSTKKRYYLQIFFFCFIL